MHRRLGFGIIGKRGRALSRFSGVLLALSYVYALCVVRASPIIGWHAELIPPDVVGMRVSQTTPGHHRVFMKRTRAEAKEIPKKYQRIDS